MPVEDTNKLIERSFDDDYRSTGPDGAGPQRKRRRLLRRRLLRRLLLDVAKTGSPGGVNPDGLRLTDSPTPCPASHERCADDSGFVEHLSRDDQGVGIEVAEVLVVLL